MDDLQFLLGAWHAWVITQSFPDWIDRLEITKHAGTCSLVAAGGAYNPILVATATKYARELRSEMSARRSVVAAASRAR